jgi:hypothetical protein
MPHPALINLINHDFQLIPITKSLTLKSLQGPTPDFEDNLQLHSAAIEDCDLFLTNDQELLNMSYFGKVNISSIFD